MSEILLPIKSLRCGICLEELCRGSISSNGTDHVCADCLAQMVMRVVDGDDPYPVKFGSLRIDVFQHAGCLDDELLLRYKQKREEYQTFPAHRIYCECGNFIGRLREQQQEGVIAAVGSCKLPGCDGWKCLFCASSLQESDLVCEHGCQQKRELATHDKLEMLTSPERGKKYQLCPNCQRLIQLTEACNHISCHCGCQFCYVCGEEADATSGHWSQGGCPRWPRREREDGVDNLMGGIRALRFFEERRAEAREALAGLTRIEQFQARRPERVQNQGHALHFQPYPRPEGRGAD